MSSRFVCLWGNTNLSGTIAEVCRSAAVIQGGLQLGRYPESDCRSARSIYIIRLYSVIQIFSNNSFYDQLKITGKYAFLNLPNN